LARRFQGSPGYQLNRSGNRLVDGQVVVATTDTSSSSGEVRMNTPKSRVIRVDWIIYFLAAAGLVGLIVWSMAKEVAGNPARDATADLGTNGLVTIRLTTDPFPALPTGVVVLNFMPMDSRQRSMELDDLTYEYGRMGDDRPVGSGIAQAMSGNGMIMFMGNAQFPVVGTWWIRARITKGNTQADVKFTVYVKPAQ
jgi:hypothetical protein